MYGIIGNKTALQLPANLGLWQASKYLDQSPTYADNRAIIFLRRTSLSYIMKFFGSFRPKKKDIPADPDPIIDEEPEKKEEKVSEAPEIIHDEIPTPDPATQSLLSTVSEYESSRRRTSFEEFVDERLLISTDVLGTKQMKIKVLEVSDEHAPVQWRFGDRIKITKILITIRHMTTQEIEEGEFDIESIERELAEKRHYTSTNRWVPTSDIKNGYVVGSRHTSLISDAVALDYIVF